MRCFCWLMRRLYLLLVICAGVCQTVRSESVEWFTDAEAAQAKAKEENKLVLLDFTGSDWCMWCKKLKREVFDKPEFAQFAQSKLVLVEVDFPQHKTLPEAQQQANARLDKTYGINSYPTVILLNPDGKQVGRMGYVFGGASAFIAKLERKVARTKAKASVGFGGRGSPGPEPRRPRKPVTCDRKRAELEVWKNNSVIRESS
jgi:thioredoxin-related protein